MRVIFSGGATHADLTREGIRERHSLSRSTKPPKQKHSREIPPAGQAKVVLAMNVTCLTVSNVHIYLLLTEFEGLTVSYGPSFFLLDLWPKREARGP